MINHEVDTQPSTQKQVVLFNIGSEDYGLEVDIVQEIIRPLLITRVPRVPAFIKGVINLRGNIIPVIDVRDLLGYRSGGKSDYTRVVITQQQETIIGLLVENVNGVVYLDDVTTEIPVSAKQIKTIYLKGIGKLGKRLVLLIDLPLLLEGTRIVS